MNIVKEKDFINIVKNLSEHSFKPGERVDIHKLDSHDFRYLKNGEFKANLHVHTTYSDGEMSVPELLDKAKELTNNNKDFLFAITDHDTIDGDKEAALLSDKYPDLNICFGVEMSTVLISCPNQPKPLQVHLLVYGVNPNDEKLNRALKQKREQKLQLAKDTIIKLNNALPEYNFTLEEAAKCHNMIAKGEDEVAHPLKKYTSGKILLNYYCPNADFSYEKPIYKFKYLFKGKEPYHITYKKALELYLNKNLPPIPDNIEKQIQKAREIYLQAHPSINHMLEPFWSFEEAVEFVITLDSGIMSIAHPARTKAYTPEFYTYLFETFKKHGKDKALFYEGYYQSYEGTYFCEWKSKIDEAAEKFGLLKTGGLDSHGHSLIERCPHEEKKKMIKIFIIFLILMIAPITLADEGYVSPESYAVNEADMTDYMDIPSQARPDIDNLDQKQKPARNVSERKVKEPKEPKAPKKPYEKTLIYKSAKWLKDQGYKYEDPHHGQKHEIKIKTREEYEKQQAEEAAKKEQNQQY